MHAAGGNGDGQGSYKTPEDPQVDPKGLAQIQIPLEGPVNTLSPWNTPPLAALPPPVLFESVHHCKLPGTHDFNSHAAAPSETQSLLQAAAHCLAVLLPCDSESGRVNSTGGIGISHALQQQQLCPHIGAL